MSFEFATSFRFQLRASRYIKGLNPTSELKVIFVWICYELAFSISSVLIYYGTQSNIRVKIYCRLHLLRASIFNFERLDILKDSTENPCSKLLWFEFATNFRFKFRASRYITGLILVKSYCRLSLLRASVFNFKRLDILRDSIEHPSKMLLSLEFSHSFYIQFRTSRYITGLNGSSKLKVIVVWIFSQLLFSVSSDSIYYVTQSDIRLESYCRFNLLRAFVFNFEGLDILRDSIEYPS